MKYLVILGDGMADEPIPALGNKTPLEAAVKPNIDRMAREGASGMLNTVPEGYHPGSEIANLGVLGYDVDEVFEGRGSLEAASMGIDIEDGEMAMRCNIICIADGKIKNHSAGHISNEEAWQLIEFLQKEMGGGDVNFFPGVSYRHLLKIKGGDKRVDCTPPHDVPGTPFMDVMPRAQVPQAEASAQLLRNLILRSQELLKNHPVNLHRMAQGKDPANSIWPWSAGYRPSMKTMQQIYGIRSGAVISAVDLIHGIGVYAGLDKIEVEGATGLYNTNYEGKAKAAIEQLKTKDFVFLHIEASDEAGHEGDAQLKLRTVEYLDSRIVAPILKEVSGWQEPVTIGLLPDHPTPCSIKTHTRAAVPFLIWGNKVAADSVMQYDEQSAREGRFGELSKDQFIRLLFSFK